LWVCLGMGVYVVCLLLLVVVVWIGCSFSVSVFVYWGCVVCFLFFSPLCFSSFFFFIPHSTYTREVRFDFASYLIDSIQVDEASRTVLSFNNGLYSLSNSRTLESRTLELSGSLCVLLVVPELSRSIPVVSLSKSLQLSNSLSLSLLSQFFGRLGLVEANRTSLELREVPGGCTVSIHLCRPQTAG
jgi:hypothetical protein